MSSEGYCFITLHTSSLFRYPKFLQAAASYLCRNTNAYKQTL